MSRGLGSEQRRILLAVAEEPARAWRVLDIQQRVWGLSRFARGSRERLVKHPMGGWQRNVEWWRPDRRANHDSNFSRALHGLARRGLIEGVRPPHVFDGEVLWVPRKTCWRITDSGFAEAAKLRDANNRDREERGGDAGHRAA
jgi:hypothetical protein